MFDELGNLLCQVVDEWKHGEFHSDGAWVALRQAVKDAAVTLEVNGQVVLAKRLESEYQQVRAAVEANAAVPLTDEQEDLARYRAYDAAAELWATLLALKRFGDQVRTPPKRKRSKPRRKAEVIAELEQYLAARKKSYDRLVPLVLQGDVVAVEEFGDTFGPTAIARQLVVDWADDTTVDSIKTTIQKLPIYKKKIQPLFGKPARAPKGWEPVGSSRNEEYVASMQRQAGLAKRQ